MSGVRVILVIVASAGEMRSVERCVRAETKQLGWAMTVLAEVVGWS